MQTPLAILGQTKVLPESTEETRKLMEKIKCEDSNYSRRPEQGRMMIMNDLRRLLIHPDGQREAAIAFAFYQVGDPQIEALRPT